MPLFDSDDMMISVDAAEYLGVTKQRIYALRDKGRIGREIAGIWLYSKTELDQGYE